MRMIGIGLMGFLLAGIALLLSTMNILETGQRYAREVLQGPQLVFEPRISAPKTDTHSVTVYRANPNTPVVLSGLPAYQSVAFAFPVDARPTSGHLQIDATTQVLHGVEGVLRISIRNARRGEMLLRSGEAERSLQIPLSPMDFARPQLVVSFSLQGTAPNVPCGPDTGIAASVEIETTSAIFLNTAQPLTSPRDRINSWGRVAHLTWPRNTDASGIAERLVQAIALKRRGLEPLFVTQMPDALDTAQTDAALAAFAPVPALTVIGSQALAQSRANAGVRRFRTQSTWRHSFDLGATSNGVHADRLDLRMAVGGNVGQPPMSLSVTLNGRLVHQAQISAAQTTIDATIVLPLTFQSGANVLETVLTTTDKRDGQCSEGPERIAELLPTSQLVFGETSYRDATTDLRANLAQASHITVAATSGATAADTLIAMHILHDIAPADVALAAASDSAKVLLITPGSPLPNVTAPGWIVTLGPDDLTVLPLSSASLAQLAQVALVVFAAPHPMIEVAS
ncbi:cellulose biosynthesis cyclic di-GMP-binding regulatory protein BcsB [uncultured Tateyamaria sp.]|uniref:cellulose biosynthesis cyclic di-GMP-binding regulatory protein BcsB n=1 Tax=uncultured Tateyamaria sp. TaxID=455651 RepID=UPI002637F0AD|nr:cellulose biosynthesis cyclic di-GMP-binding regulatory protein BcsB [uncultured Tateyamaria sp.]